MTRAARAFFTAGMVLAIGCAPSDAPGDEAAGDTAGDSAIDATLVSAYLLDSRPIESWSLTGVHDRPALDLDAARVVLRTSSRVGCMGY